jgi:CheY-like chemotaxis protein
VDDEPDAVELIEFNLKSMATMWTTAADGESSRKGPRALPNLIIRDIMLPEWTAWRLQNPATISALPHPIVMLTAKAAEIDRVLGLGGRRRLRDEAVQPARTCPARETTIAHRGRLKRRSDQIVGRN